MFCACSTCSATVNNQLLWSWNKFDKAACPLRFSQPEQAFLQTVSVLISSPCGNITMSYIYWVLSTLRNNILDYIDTRKCFTGKYATHIFHTNIRDPCANFPYPHIDDVASDVSRWLKRVLQQAKISQNGVLFVNEKEMLTSEISSPLENRLHIFSPSCNILYV